MYWTRDNLQSNPCFSNMDGKNTAWKKGDVIAEGITVYGDELLVPITDENTNLTLLISSDLKEYSDIEKVLSSNKFSDFHFKFNAAMPPPDPNDLTPEVWRDLTDNGVVVEDKENRAWLYNGNKYCDFFAFYGEHPHFGTDYSTSQTGPWDDVNTWGGGGFPTTGDGAAIGAHTVTIQGAEACLKLAIDGAGTLTFDGQTNTVAATLTLGNSDGIANAGAINQTGTGSTGYASIIGVSKEAIVTNAPTLGAGYWKFNQVDFQMTVTTGGGGCTVDLSGDCDFDAVTISNADTWNVVSYTMFASAAVTVGGGTSGVMTFTTGTLHVDGAFGLSAGSTTGSNTAYTLNCDGAMTLTTTATFNSPTGAGAMTVAGNLTGTTTMTWNQNGVTTVLDGATQTLTGFSNAAATTVLGNLTISTSTTCTVTGTNMVGYNQSVVLTINMTGSLTGSCTLYVSSSNANPVVFTATPAGSWGGNFSFRLDYYDNCNYPALTATGISNFQVLAKVTGKQLTQTGNINVSCGTFRNYPEDPIAANTWAQGTTMLTITASDTIYEGFSSGRVIAHTITTGTITFSATNGIQVNAGMTFGSNSNYVLDINSSFTNAGTTNLPNATGTCTFSGTTWTETAAVTANSGLVTFDKAGTTTLGSNATSFYSVTISNGTTLDTSAASNYSLTCAAAMQVGGGTSGVLTTNNSTCIFGSGYTGAAYWPIKVKSGATLTASTGAHTYGGLYAENTSNVTFTSGTTTINGGLGAQGICITIITPTTFAHNSGTINFTYAGLQTLYDSTNTARTLNNVAVIKGAGNILQYTNTFGFALTCAGTLTISSGVLSTIEITSAVSRNLTVTGATSVSGTLTCNASTVIHTGAVTVNGGGAYNFSTATTTIATSFDNAGTTTIGLNTTFNGTVAGKAVTNTSVWTWNTCSMKWLDLQFDVVTPGTGKTFTWTGDMTIDAWTTSITDTLTCTVADTTITVGATKDVISSGNMTINGTSGHNIIWTGGHRMILGNSTTDHRYVTLNFTDNTSGYVLSVGTTGVYTAFDNVTVNNVGGSQGAIYCGSTVNPFTATNSTFNGANGGIYTQEDIVIFTNAKVQLTGCTYTTVGMYNTGGWLISMDDQAVAGATVFMGILASSETPAAGYRAANVTGTFLIRNANSYGTPFNSSYTLGANMTSMTTFTSNASTTFDTSGTNYTLTMSGTSNITGSLLMNGSTVSMLSCTLNNGGLFDISTGNITMTQAGAVNCFIANGTANLGTGTHSIGITCTWWAISIGVTGIVDEESCVVTYGPVNVGASATYTLTSNTTTVTSAYTVIGDCWNVDATSTIDYTGNELIFTYAGACSITDNNATHPQDVTINNAACILNPKTTNMVVSNDLTITLGQLTTTDGASRDLTVGNDLSIAAGGTLTANASTITVTGDAGNENIFTCGTSTFIMNGALQNITGSWTFKHFTKAVVAADTLTWEAGETYSFTGNVTINGAAGQLLTLASSIPGTYWNFTMSAGSVKTAIHHLIVSDSDATGSLGPYKPINPASSINGGHTLAWFLSAGGASALMGGMMNLLLESDD